MGKTQKFCKSLDPSLSAYLPSEVSPSSTRYNPNPLSLKTNSPNARIGKSKRFQMEKQLKHLAKFVPHSYSGVTPDKAVSRKNPRPIIS